MNVEISDYIQGHNMPRTPFLIESLQKYLCKKDYRKTYHGRNHYFIRILDIFFCWPSHIIPPGGLGLKPLRVRNTLSGTLMIV